MLGNQAMVKLTEAKVLLHGLGSLGLEIGILCIILNNQHSKHYIFTNYAAKNLVLAGVGSLTLIDSRVSDLYDLGSQFFVNESHVDAKTNR